MVIKFKATEDCTREDYHNLKLNMEYLSSLIDAIHMPQVDDLVLKHINQALNSLSNIKNKILSHKEQKEECIITELENAPTHAKLKESTHKITKIVKLNDLLDIRDMANRISDLTDNNEIGATAFDIIGILDKYDAGFLFGLDEEGKLTLTDPHKQ